MTEHLDIDKCVDDQIREEMRGGGFPFERLMTLKLEDPKCWVSPDCSMEMFAYVERAALRRRDDDHPQD